MNKEEFYKITHTCLEDMYEAYNRHGYYSEEQNANDLYGVEKWLMDSLTIKIIVNEYKEFLGIATWTYSNHIDGNSTDVWIDTAFNEIRMYYNGKIYARKLDDSELIKRINVIAKNFLKTPRWKRIKDKFNNE